MELYYKKGRNYIKLDNATLSWYTGMPEDGLWIVKERGTHAYRIGALNHDIVKIDAIVTGKQIGRAHV